jgi:hypothetical protein
MSWLTERRRAKTTFDTLRRIVKPRENEPCLPFLCVTEGGRR